jgi:hypothetical protein
MERGLSTTATMGQVFLTVACEGLKMMLSHPRWGPLEISRSSVRGGLCRFEKWRMDIGVTSCVPIWETKKIVGRSSGVEKTED